LIIVYENLILKSNLSKSHGQNYPQRKDILWIQN